ncbi:MAG: hypothetical protein ACE37F_05250 [Nannocystaceae bacterium]|nr:hypothetical protein [bacterium]
MLHASSIRASLALAAAALLSGGCDLIDAFQDDGDTLITVFANHQASAEDGQSPDLGSDGDTRVFDNDEGWTISLASGVITTTGVTLERCDGQQSAVDFYFGTVAEDLRTADFDRRTLGGTEVGAGSFCGMTVHYGPFSAATDDPPGAMDPAQVDGLTVYLVGVAERGEERVPFEIAIPGAADVHLDLADGPDGPLNISGNEPFPVELTVSKTYDRLFDGIDFSGVSEDDIAANAAAMLELETTVIVSK